MTFGVLSLYLVLYNRFGLDQWLAGEYRLIKYILISPFFVIPTLAQLDARSRFQNYKQIKDQLYHFGFNERIVRPVLKSRCQRDAAITAAEELGFGHECLDYFKGKGYRWYHLLPDFVFSRPQFLLTGVFWRTTFFMPAYKPRYDFRTILSNYPFSNSGCRA